MTDSNYTAIKLILDRSGSMASIQAASEEAINGFIQEQKKLPGRATIAISQFDTVYDVVNASIPPDQVPAYQLVPRGGTALLDAIGRGATEFGEELAKLPESERPGSVILAIMTDGEENSSREWTWDQVKDLITQQQDQWSWTVIYLGANQDAIATGAKMGMRDKWSMTYAATDVGTQSATRSLSTAVYAASSATPGVWRGYTDQEREEAMGGEKAKK